MEAKITTAAWSARDLRERTRGDQDAANWLAIASIGWAVFPAMGFFYFGAFLIAILLQGAAPVGSIIALSSLSLAGALAAAFLIFGAQRLTGDRRFLIGGVLLASMAGLAKVLPLALV